MRTCSVEGCAGKFRARGLCGKHYERWRNHGDVNIRFGYKDGDGCLVIGCDRKRKSRGYCGMHYVRISKNGDVGSADSTRLPKSCSVDGCDKKSVARSLCNTHYQRWNKHGEAGGSDLLRVTGQTVCRVDDCDSYADSRHLCVKHYKRWQLYGEAGIERPSERDPWHVITYRGAHRRVEAVKGSAKNHLCTFCKDPASEWSYMHDDPNEVIDSRGIAYSQDPDRYQPACVPCHRIFDTGRVNSREHNPKL